MALPIYNKNLLPCITYPIDNTKKESKRYLGGSSYTYRTSANININAMTDEEVTALHDFWETDCNNGLDPFYLQIPLFGKKVGGEYPYYLVRFVGDFKAAKNNLLWDTSLGVKRVDDLTYSVIPTTPTNFLASDGEIGQVTVSWTASTTSAQIASPITYSLHKDGIEVADNITSPYTYITSVGAATYKVKASNEYGDSEFSNEDIGESVQTVG